MGLVYKNSIIKPNSTYRKSPNGGFYYNNELWFSKAYQKLNKSSMRLLHCFLLECRYIKGKKKSNKKYPDNGRISFTEVQYKELFGSSSTYLGARNQLIECGFIKQTYRGGMCRGDMAQYKILCLPDVPLTEQRWREYPEKNWLDNIPKAKNNQVGIKSRWKKGESGRKSKTTLPKYTHNEANDPIKVYPNK